MSSNESVVEGIKTHEDLHSTEAEQTAGEAGDAVRDNHDSGAAAGGQQTSDAVQEESAVQAASEPGMDAGRSDASRHDVRGNTEQQSEATGSGAESTEQTEPLRRRLRLAPTLNSAQARPIPTIRSAPAAEGEPAQGSSANRPAEDITESNHQFQKTTDTAMHQEAGAALATPDDAAATAPAAEIAASPAAEPAPPRHKPRPVELPPADLPLDAELEAEIEAAMASGQMDLLDRAPTTAEPEEGEQDEAAEVEGGLAQGARLTGKIQSLHGDDVFLDIGQRCPAVVSRRQFVSGKRPEVGQLIEVFVDRVDEEEGLIHVNLPKGLRKVAGNWESLAVGQVVDCIVTGTNKGGLEVTVSNLRGFLPASQVDLNFVSDLQPFLGQKLRVQVMEVQPRKRNLIVSRRAYLAVERKEAEEVLWKSLEVDQVFSGKVKTIKDYGAFVDLGGVDGFLHVGEISWVHIKHPQDVITEGQQVDVKVIGLDPEKKKISLGMRQLTQNPWNVAAEKYAVGSTVQGTVTRTANFGAFVELEPGIEGLVHISELDHHRVGRVTDVLKAGQTVDAQVLEVDPERKRIALSLKALLAKPEVKTDADLAPSAGAPLERKRKGPLKGGTSSIGSTGGGKLFGNPKDWK